MPSTLKTRQRIPDLPLDIPQFASEEEEAFWWDRNSDRISEMVMRRGVKGKLVRIRAKTQNVSLRIPVTDLEHAKRLAAKTKEPYQTVLKRALHSGLNHTAA